MEDGQWTGFVTPLSLRRYKAQTEIDSATSSGLGWAELELDSPGYCFWQTRCRNGKKSNNFGLCRLIFEATGFYCEFIQAVLPNYFSHFLVFSEVLLECQPRSHIPPRSGLFCWFAFFAKINDYRQSALILRFLHTIPLYSRIITGAQVRFRSDQNLFESSEIIKSVCGKIPCIPKSPRLLCPERLIISCCRNWKTDSFRRFY